MSYKLTYEIQIGNYVFQDQGISSVEIRSSWKELTDTATITIPRNIYAVKSGKKVDFTKELIPETIKRGDRVEIKLGYNGQNVREFIGYVREPEASIPFVIHCEDEMLNLKKKALTTSYETVSLKTLISDIAPRYKSICADTSFSSYGIENATPARVLEDLKNFSLYAYFDLEGSLHVDLPYSVKYNTHVYSFDQNVRENNLRFRRAENIRLLVKAISNKVNGKKEVYQFGDLDGEIRTLNFGDISPEQLKKLAQEEAKRFKFDGYQGELTGWGWPVTRHGDVAKIKDSRYPEREGSYLIDAVTIQFGNGFRRINTLGPRV